MTIGFSAHPLGVLDCKTRKKSDKVLQAHEYIQFLQKLQAVEVNMVTGGGGTYASAHPTCQQNLQVFINGLFNKPAYALASHLKYHRCFTASLFLLMFFYLPPSPKWGTVGHHFWCSGPFAEHNTALQILKTIALRSIPLSPLPLHLTIL